tara:strand:- start:193 stop:339 length:147 start_codon:yes stop_codon:yes gene_type:complete
MSKDSKKYTIPENGSLGLLALGDIGLIKWREKKALEAKKKKKSDKKNG